MEATSKTKTISTDICMSVWLSQNFKVPVDYEIIEATPLEAYQSLISKFGDQNVDAVNEPFGLDLMDVHTIGFEAIDDEFIQHPTNGLNIK